MSIEDLKKDWEEMAKLDPYWAILGVPSKQYGKWDIDEFFHTGEIEIKNILDILEELEFSYQKNKVLDFGCGVGRLTRELSKKFGKCYGVDISETMIELAKYHNKEYSNCEFIVNDKEDLKVFKDNFFDFIYTNIVLQHIPDAMLIKSYLEEFLRILNPGGILIFQLPTHTPNFGKSLPKQSKFRELREKGFSADFLYEQKKIVPIRMNCIPEKDVEEIIKNNEGKIIRKQSDNMAGSEVDSMTYFVTKYISK